MHNSQGTLECSQGKNKKQFGTWCIYWWFASSCALVNMSTGGCCQFPSNNNTVVNLTSAHGLRESWWLINTAAFLKFRTHALMWAMKSIFDGWDRFIWALVFNLQRWPVLREWGFKHFTGSLDFKNMDETAFISNGGFKEKYKNNNNNNDNI